MSRLWNDKESSLRDLSILTDQILDKYIDLFWKEVVSQISDSFGQYILLLIRIRYENNQIVSLSNMQTINLSSKANLSQFIKDRLSISNENYKTITIQSVIFSYGIREGEIAPKIGPIQNKNIKYQIYYRNELPIAMLPEDYGLILSKINNTYTISIEKGKHNALIILMIPNIGNQIVNHIKYFKNNKLLFSWTDTIVSLEDKKFIRGIGKSIIHYEDGEISLYTTIKKTSPMVPKKSAKNKQLNYKFITMDLETITYNNILIPYLLC